MDKKKLPNNEIDRQVRKYTSEKPEPKTPKLKVKPPPSPKKNNLVKLVSV